MDEMKSPARPELEAALLMLGPVWDDALSGGWHQDIAHLLDTADYRGRGSIQGQWQGQNYRGSIDLRMRLKHDASGGRSDSIQPQVWIKVKDPLLGMPLGHGQVLDSGITFYSPIVRRAWHVPAELAVQHAIPVALQDLQRLLLAHPVAFPSDISTLNLDATADAWELAFVYPMDGRHADVILRFSKQTPYPLLSQSVSTEGMLVDVTYQSDAIAIKVTEEATATIKGQLEIKLRNTQTDRIQQFPFIVPSGYAVEQL